MLGMPWPVHHGMDSCLVLRLTKAWQEMLYVVLDLTVVELSSR